MGIECPFRKFEQHEDGPVGPEKEPPDVVPPGAQPLPIIPGRRPAVDEAKTEGEFEGELAEKVREQLEELVEDFEPEIQEEVAEPDSEVQEPVGPVTKDTDRWRPPQRGPDRRVEPPERVSRPEPSKPPQRYP